MSTRGSTVRILDINTFDAFIECGASEATARKAASHDVAADLAGIRTELGWIKLVGGAAVLALAGLFWQLFEMNSRLAGVEATTAAILEKLQ